MNSRHFSRSGSVRFVTRNVAILIDVFFFSFGTMQGSRNGLNASLCVCVWVCGEVPVLCCERDRKEGTRQLELHSYCLYLTMLCLICVRFVIEYLFISRCFSVLRYFSQSFFGNRL